MITLDSTHSYRGIFVSVTIPEGLVKHTPLGRSEIALIPFWA